MSFLDFLERCLEWDPLKRITPKEALSHPFITKSRFIPKPAGDITSQTIEMKRKPLVKNKYLSTADIKIDRDISRKINNLNTKGSFNSMRNRLPAVASLTRLGEQISNVVKVRKDRTSNGTKLPTDSMKFPNSGFDNALPPISRRNDNFKKSSSFLLKDSGPKIPNWK
jgi:dual specificity tyrosine-phosphorylation-regulated kinase 2/3/4